MKESWTWLEVFEGKNTHELRLKKEQTDKDLLKGGWRHKEVSLAVNSHSGFCIMAVIYEREKPSDRPGIPG